MLIDILGIKEDFSEPYGIHKELSDYLHSQSDLPQHFAGYFCPICQNVNYVDTEGDHDTLLCFGCGYKGAMPDLDDEDSHHVGCDCEYCKTHEIVGLDALPVKDECAACVPRVPTFEIAANIFSSIKLAADSLADIQKQIEIVSNNPNVTIVCECRWDSTEHLKHKYD